MKLKKLDTDNKKRRQIAAKYYRNINNPNIQILPICGLEHVYHLFVVRTSCRDKLAKFLHDRMISTLIHYPIPPHKQEAYHEFKDVCLPTTEAIHDELISLPISPVMDHDSVDNIIKACNDFAV